FRLPGAEAFANKVAYLTDEEILNNDEETRTAGAELFGLLLQPFAERIKGKDLVIVPDGSLCHLPFELLVEHDQYLIENHRLRCAPSLSTLHMVHQWEKKRTQPDRLLFAVGDPVFGPDDQRLLGTPTLLASQRGELEAIAWSEGRTRGEEGFGRLKESGAE